MRSWLAFAVAAALAQPAAAFDLTGTWTGKQSCKGSAVGEKISFSFPSELLITQNGTDLNIHVVSDSGTDIYQSVGIDDLVKPENGAVYFVHCGTTDIPETGDEFDENGRASVKTKEASGTGSFKGTSTFFNIEPVVASCKWSYKRTSTTDPAVKGGCPDL